MSAPTLTRRYPVASTVAGKQQEFLANIVVLRFFKDHWRREEFKPLFGARDKWYDGSAQNQVYFKPTTLGISKANIKTLGAGLHRRNPVIGIHVFTRDPDAMDQITEGIDRIIKDHGVNPYEGVQYVLPADLPSVAQDEIDDNGKTLYHNTIFVEILYHKWRA